MKSERKYLYISFINWCEGEIHLRRCDVAWETDDQIAVNVVYDEDYNEKYVTRLVIGKDCLKENGFLAGSDKDAFMICHDKIKHHEWGPTWNTLYARAGETRKDALEKQRRMLENQISQFEDRIETAKSILDQINKTTNEGAAMTVYDTEWNRVEQSPLIQLARCADEDAA